MTTKLYVDNLSAVGLSTDYLYAVDSNIKADVKVDSVDNGGEKIATITVNGVPTEISAENAFVHLSGDVINGKIHILSSLEIGEDACAAGQNSLAQGSACSALADNSTSLGYDTKAGGFGYKVLSILRDANQICVEIENDIPDIVINDDISFRSHGNTDFCGKVTSIENHTDDKYALISVDKLSRAFSGNPTVLFFVQHLYIGETPIAECCYSEGYSTAAVGYPSHAEGYASYAGKYAHAENKATIASWGSHAEGEQTSALGIASHTGGKMTMTEGHSTFSHGHSCSALANYSIATGAKAYAKETGSFVWQGISSDWNGSLTVPIDDSTLTTYESHGKATFNINPADGIDGFYVGDKNVHLHVNDIVDDRFYNEILNSDKFEEVFNIMTYVPGIYSNGTYITDAESAGYDETEGSPSYIIRTNSNPTIEVLRSNTMLTIEDGLTDPKSIYPTTGFAIKSNLKIVNLPNVKKIGVGAFHDCGELTTVKANSAENVGTRSFRYCYKLESISIKNAVTFGTVPFDGCKSLKTIYVDNDVYKSTNDNAIVRYANDLGKVKLIAFALQQLEDDTITSIDKFAAYGVSLLKRIVLPNLKTINAVAIYHCSSLTYLDIHNVQKIDDTNFWSASRLECVDFSERDVSLGIPSVHSGAFNNYTKNLKIVVPDELYDEWLANAEWNAAISSTKLAGYSLEDHLVKASEY